MRSTYSPQKHAEALEDWRELLQQLAREIASLHSKIDRLLYAMPKERDGSEDAPLDALVQAAFAAMGIKTWSCGELIGRTLGSDPAALALSSAIGAACKLTAGSLGIYLNSKISGTSYVTRSGYEIQRIGRDGNVWSWTVKGVSNPKTQASA